MKEDSFLMRIPNFGNLYMYEVLDNFIYPRIFIVTNDADEKILMYEMVNGYKNKEQDYLFLLHYSNALLIVLQESYHLLNM